MDGGVKGKDLEGSRQIAKQCLRRHEDMRTRRSGIESDWRIAAEYCYPNSSAIYSKLQHDYRPRSRLDATSVLATQRLAAMMYGQVFSPFTPFIVPYAVDFEPDYDASVFFERASKYMHSRLMSARSGFDTNVFAALTDFAALGNGPIWMVPRPDQGLGYIAQDVMRIWIDEDEQGRINAVHREIELPAWRASKIYPQNEALRKLASKPDTELQLVQILQCVSRRWGGRIGAVRTNKPWQSVTLLMSGSDPVQALEESGYDTFPCAYLRFHKRAGRIYADGPGISAAPHQSMANRMADSIARSWDLANDPPFVEPRGLIAKLDRRAGGRTEYNPLTLQMSGLQSVTQAFTQLQLGGDLNAGVAMAEREEARILALFYTDWMTNRGNVQRTATEASIDEDLRLRSLQPLTARMATDGLEPMAEAEFADGLQRGVFGPVPDSLRGREIRFHYASTLQQAGRRREVEEMMQGLNAVATGEQVRSATDTILRMDQFSRQVAMDSGVPHHLIRTADEIAANARDTAALAQAQEQVDLAASAAPAISSAAQLAAVQ